MIESDVRQRLQVATIQQYLADVREDVDNATWWHTSHEIGFQRSIATETMWELEND